MLHTTTLVVGAAAVIAAAENPTSIPTTITLGGVLAIFLGLVVADKWGPHGERDRLRKELAEKNAELSAQDTAIRERLIPTVIENTRLLGEVANALAQVTERLRTRRSS